MKSIFKILCVSFLACISTITCSFAQTNIWIGAQTGTFFSPFFHNPNPFSGFMLNTSGVFAEYELNKHIRVKGAYNKWLDLLNAGITSSVDIQMPDKKGIYFGDWKPGIIENWNNYNLLDLSLSYYTSIKKHNFFVDAGFSYAYGKNDVITAVHVEPGYHDILANTERVKRTCTGLMYETGYNYSIIHNRAAVGLAFCGRKYIDAFSQYSINVQCAYKLSIKSKSRTNNSEK